MKDFLGLFFVFVLIGYSLYVIFCLFIDYFDNNRDSYDGSDDVFFDSAPMPKTPPLLPPSPFCDDLSFDQLRLKEFMKQREQKIKEAEKIY